MTVALASHDSFVSRAISAKVFQADRPEIVRLQFAGIPKIHRWASLDKMRDTTESRYITIVERFVDHLLSQADTDDDDVNYFDAPVAASKRGMVLTGPPGTGKTSIAVAAMREWATRTEGKRPCAFLEFAPLIERIKQGYGGDVPPIDIEAIAKHNDLVILDDLGQVRSTEWVSSQYYALINALYVHSTAVIITTNIQLEQFETMINAAVRSRIGGMCEYVPLVGTDRRL